MVRKYNICGGKHVYFSVKGDCGNCPLKLLQILRRSILANILKLFAFINEEAKKRIKE